MRNPEKIRKNHKLPENNINLYIYIISLIVDLEETAATKQLKKLQIHSVKITRGHRTSDKRTNKHKKNTNHTLVNRDIPC